ncbi:hypothetical protein AVEN_166317-1 [Araneus ventricosus]|uniref:Uncharacterized protein n=1 Tax=Araneus ventricosus TaxID=182803 RepID=A0A4Y2U655_ARAVE|nr:hypothetical protein AVEN_166317-1 [Araneus ventricosus]
MRSEGHPFGPRSGFFSTHSNQQIRQVTRNAKFGNPTPPNSSNPVPPQSGRRHVGRDWFWQIGQIRSFRGVGSTDPSPVSDPDPQIRSDSET